MIGSGQLGKAGEQTEGEESEGEDGEAEGDYTVYECPGLASVCTTICIVLEVFCITWLLKGLRLYVRA